MDQWDRRHTSLRKSGYGTPPPETISLGVFPHFFSLFSLPQRRHGTHTPNCQLTWDHFASETVTAFDLISHTSSRMTFVCKRFLIGHSAALSPTWVDLEEKSETAKEGKWNFKTATRNCKRVTQCWCDSIRDDSNRTKKVNALGDCCGLPLGKVVYLHCTLLSHRTSVTLHSRLLTWLWRKRLPWLEGVIKSSENRNQILR